MILLTGFEKFGQYTQNLSEYIVRSFSNNILNQILTKKVLPVSWKKSIKIYRNLVRRTEYHLVILTGIHAGKKVLIENFAWNLAFGLDNYHNFKLGFIRLLKPIRLKSIINALDLFKKLQVSDNIAISNYAGSYLCNYLYYWALYFAQKAYPVIFIHIPAKSNPETMKETVYLIIKTMVSILNL